MRALELRLSQTQIDGNVDPVFNQILPLVVFLRDKFCDTTYEDVYYFTQEGFSLAHGWRIFDKTQGKYVNENFSYDKNMNKLESYKEIISEMFGKYPLRRQIENNPVIKRLKKGLSIDSALN